LLAVASAVDSLLFARISAPLSARFYCPYGNAGTFRCLDFVLKARDVFLDGSLSWRFQVSRSRSSALGITTETKRASGLGFMIRISALLNFGSRPPDILLLAKM
jgi:hypothetical protein